MDCHISFNNTWMRVFRDQELFKHRAPFSDIILSDASPKLTGIKDIGRRVSGKRKTVCGYIWEKDN